MFRPTALLLAALIGATLALPAAAQWKWKDGKGQVQYSDLPPPQGTPEKDILQRPNGALARSTAAVAAPAAAPAASGASAPALTAKGVEPALEAKRKEQEAAEAAKKKAEEQRVAAVKADNCMRARSQLRTLESGVRIARTNDKGEREILDDQALAGEVKRARDVMASDCK
jgi:hypothetical protein